MLLARNIALAKTNLVIVEAFIEGHRWACAWTRPVAGTTAFVRFERTGKRVDDVEFCKKLMERTGVMFVPGSKCFGVGREFRGYLRLGFICEMEMLRERLEAVRGLRV